MSHLNYYDATTDSTPLPQYVEAREARRKAFRAFWRGSIFGALLATGAFVASAAFGETISIGTLYTHGEAGKATTVTIMPSDVPGQLAIVTLQNNYVNQGADNGDYSLTLDGMTVGVRFFWDHDPVLGSDRITLTPPAGITCEPADCGITVMEGAVGSVVLFDYLGF
jgi:hypothetical protein